MSEEQLGRPQHIPRALHFLIPLLAVVVFGLAVLLVRRILHQHTPHEIFEAVLELPKRQMTLALLTTAISYLMLTGYDMLGFLYVGRAFSYWRIIFTAFMAYAMTNSIGMANVAGTSIRLRLYTHWGLSVADVVRVIVFCSLSFWLGFAGLAGTMFLTNPPLIEGPYAVSPVILRAIGALFTLVVVLYWFLSWLKLKPLNIRNFKIEIPPLYLAVPQVIVAGLDWATAALVLYELLPQGANVTYPAFLSIFVAAQVVALISHVPGGVGVLEALVLALLAPHDEQTSQVAAALVAFRAIYYLLPLVVAIVLLVLHELFRDKRTGHRRS